MNRKGEVNQRVRYTEAVTLPAVKTPYFQIGLAFFLFAAGLSFLLAGLFASVDLILKISFLLIGAMCFIPGVYFVFLFVQAYRGIRGFSYQLFLDEAR